MGFIDKALAKAKAEKQRTQGTRPPVSPKATPEVEPGTPPPFVGSGIITGGIKYTTTRTVPVQSEVLHRQRIITENNDEMVREEYKMLRTQILQRTKAEHKNTLMITGPLPGEGKTLTAINLAISLSHEVDKTVLLVEADLRSPSVNSYFGLPDGPGLVDYLAGDISIPNLLLHPQGFDKLVILPGGQAVAGAAELIGSPMMGDLVKELKHFYPNRYVLFDLPPILPFADPLAFAPLVDGIILVVEMGKTSRENIQNCLELFKDLPIIGLVLNKVDQKDQTHHYYYYQKTNEPPERKKGLLGWVRF